MAHANVLAARAGYATCTRQHRLAGDSDVRHVAGRGRSDPRPRAVFPISTLDSLRNHTGSWSEEQPTITDECTACALCALFCPEGVIVRSDGRMVIDTNYCKGCGICEAVCPVRGAIRMEEVLA
jgi:pyruvate ferredoxin oxidoreductase delta subunit